MHVNHCSLFASTWISGDKTTLFSARSAKWGKSNYSYINEIRFFATHSERWLWRGLGVERQNPYIKKEKGRRFVTDIGGGRKDWRVCWLFISNSWGKLGDVGKGEQIPFNSNSLLFTPLRIHLCSLERYFNISSQANTLLTISLCSQLYNLNKTLTLKVE